MSNVCLAVFTVRLTFLGFLGDFTGVYAQSCTTFTCGVNRDTYLRSSKTCLTMAFPHEPKEYIGERCAGDQPFQCYRTTNRFNNIRGMQRRVRVDMEHPLPSGRVTHLTFSTSYGSKSGVKGQLVVVEAVGRARPPTSVRVVVAVRISCDADTPMWQDHCVALPKPVRINADVGDFYLGYISNDDDSSQQAYNWYYLEKSAKVGMFLSDPLFKPVETDDMFEVIPAYTEGGWPSDKVLLYVNAKIVTAACTCQSCGTGERCLPYEEHCSCSPGFQVTTESNKIVCRECPNGKFGLSCEGTCNCVTSYTQLCRKADGLCVCTKGFEGARCEMSSADCAFCSHPTKVCLRRNGIRCLCRNGTHDPGTGRCVPCSDDSWGLNCEQRCKCGGEDLVSTCDAVTGMCMCQTGYMGRKCEDDVDECAERPGPCVELLEVCENTVGSYTCKCAENAIPYGPSGTCQELAVDIILDPPEPVLDRLTIMYLVVGLPSNYQTSINFRVDLTEKPIVVNAWDGFDQKPGPDAFSWEARPYAWAGPLAKVIHPKTVTRLAWHFSPVLQTVQVTSSERAFGTWKKTFFSLLDAEATCWNSLQLANCSKGWSSVTTTVRRNESLESSILRSDLCDSSVRFTETKWSLYPMKEPTTGNYVDLASQQAMTFTGQATDRLVARGTQLPTGLLRVCASFLIPQKSNPDVPLLKCGYTKVIPADQITVVLTPQPSEPTIAADVGTVIDFDARRSYSVDREDTGPPRRGEYTFDWDCIEVDKESGAEKGRCTGPGNQFPEIADPIGTKSINTGVAPFKHGHRYQIKVKVKWQTLEAEDFRIVDVISSPGLLVRISCLYNCFINARPNDYVKLRCDALDGSPIAGKWRVTTSEQTWSGESLQDISSGTSETSTLTIEPYAFQGGRSYTFFFMPASNLSNTGTGEASYVITFGQGPSGGQCVVHPTSGSALVTKFTVYCSDWVSTDSMLKYKVFVKPAGKRDIGTLLTFGFEPIMGDLLLPEGQFHPISNLSHKVLVSVEVVDSLGFTGCSVNVVTVYPAAISREDEGSHAFQVSQELRSDVATDDVKLVTRTKSTLVSMIKFINKEAEEKPAVFFQERRTKIRENLLMYMARTVTVGADDVEQMSTTLESLTTQEKEIPKASEVYVLEIVETLSVGLDKTNNVRESQIDDLARKQLGVMDRLTRWTVTDNSFRRAYRDSELSKEYSEKAPRFDKVLETIASALLRTTTSTTTSRSLTTNSTGVAVTWREAGRSDPLSSKAVTSSLNADVVIDSASIPQHLQNLSLELSVALSTNNHYEWVPSSENVSLPLVIVSVFDRNTKERQEVANLSQPIHFFLEYNHTAGRKWDSKRVLMTSATHQEVEEREVLRVKVFHDHSTLVNLTVSPASLRVSVTVILERANVSNTTPQSKVVKHVTQEPSILLLPAQDDPGDADSYRIVVTSKGFVTSNKTSESPDLPVVDMFALEVSCMTWNANKTSWERKGCRVSEVSNFDVVVCECTHLSTFSGGLFVTPNPIEIDFTLFLEFFHNPAMVSVVVLLWLCYFVGLFWANHADSLDKAQSGICVLQDNSVQDSYVYLVCTVTGWWRNAGTTAQVYIYLNGTFHKSRVHHLEDPEREVFFQGAENWFLLTSPSQLGDLVSVVIWHDNSGSSPEWFLKEVYVQEPKSGNEWHCLYNDWLSVVSGTLCVEVPALTPPQVARHQTYVFVSQVSQQLRSEHLWLSIVSKPCYSKFTRKQRLTCALCVLLSMMLASLMFHGIPTDDPRDQLGTGTINFNVKALIIGIQSALIVGPFTWVLVMLFTHISPREALQGSDDEDEWSDSIFGRGSADRSENCMDGAPDAGQVTVDAHRTAVNPDFSATARDLNRKPRKKSRDVRISESWVECPYANPTGARATRTDKSRSEEQEVAGQPDSVSRRPGSVHSDGQKNKRRKSPEWIERGRAPASRVLSENRPRGVARERPAEQASSSWSYPPVSENQRFMEANAGVGDGCYDDMSARPRQEILQKLQARSAFRRQMAQQLAEQEVNVNRNATVHYRFDPDVGMYVVRDKPQTRCRKVRKCCRSVVRCLLSYLFCECECQCPMMPWWGWYLAWGFTLTMAVVCSLLVMLYGLKMGYQGSVDWLLGFFTAWLTDSFCLEPVQALGMGLAMAFVIRRIVNVKDEAAISLVDEDQEYMHTKKLQEFERRKNLLGREWRPTEYHYPISQTTVKDIQVRMEQDLAAVEILREALMYVVFVSIIAVIITGHIQMYDAFSTNTVLRKAFDGGLFSRELVPLAKVKTKDDIWRYLDRTILPSLKNTVDNATINRESYLLGRSRIRQVRQNLGTEPCQGTASETLARYFRETRSCYPYFSPQLTDTRHFADSWAVEDSSSYEHVDPADPYFDPDSDAAPWRYRQKDAEFETYVSGLFGSYPPSGYVVDLPRTVEFAQDRLYELHTAKWLDSNTRAVFVTFTLYCPNTDLATEVTLLWEVSPEGRIWSRLELHTTKVRYYDTKYEQTVMTLEISFIVMLIMYAYFEIRTMVRIGWRAYLSSFWGWLEIAVLVLGVVTITLHARRLVLVETFLSTLRATRNNRHVSFASVSAVERASQAVRAALLALVTLKAFKLLRFNRHFRVVTETMSQVKVSLVNFAFWAVVLLMAFAGLALPVFISSLHAYRSLPNAFMSLFTFSLGQTDYYGMKEASPLLGPLIFFLFAMLFSVITVYFFITIIVEAYSVTRVYVHLNPDEKHVLHYVADQVKLLFGINPAPRAVPRRKRPTFRKPVAKESYLDKLKQSQDSRE